MADSQDYDIAILGAGFSGAMVAAHLVREASGPLRIALIDPAPHLPKGAAYSTPRPEHLLNVRANQMGAFADDPQGFFQWLNGRAAPDAFVPRQWYGEYLASIHEETRQLATKRGMKLDRHTWQATRIALDGARYAIAGETHIVHARQLVLATGNQIPRDDAQGIIHTPWAYDYQKLPAASDAPVWIIGSGLTAVDTVLSLDAAGYTGRIHMLSRHAALPAPHPPAPLPALSFPAAMLYGKSLAQAMRSWRRWASAEIAKGASWQATIDALRPHTVALWEALPAAERSRFFRHLWSVWNRHRHRMAPEIAVQLTRLQEHGALTLHKGSLQSLSPERVIWRDAKGKTQTTQAALIFDCRGPRYTPSAMPWLTGLLEASVIAPSSTGFGLMQQTPFRISADAHPPLYALGPLLLGERLETTAVPELRAQAQTVARLLLQRS